MHFKGRSCPNCGKKTTLNFLNFEAEDKITCCYCGKSFSKVEWLRAVPKKTIGEKYGQE